MAKSLQIIEDQIELGDVKTITSNGGQNVKFIELLFSPTVRAQFAPSKDMKTVEMSIFDNNLELPDLDCKMSKGSLYDLIVSLKKIYTELESEV